MTAATGQIYRQRELDMLRSSPAARDALFAAVLIDDEVDPGARVPDVVQLDITQDELAACFGLTRALWYDGFDRSALIELTAKLVRDRDLSEADRLRFKHIRAKFKHFRYAFALYSAGHRYPAMLDRVTITMGHLQDGYRNGRRGMVLREAILLRMLMCMPAVRRMRRQADRLVLTTPAVFRQRLRDDAATMTALASALTITGPQFHRTRKAIGRQVSFWDTLRTIAPTADRYNMSRSLSAINGLMGDLHDVLVERRSRDRTSYDAAFYLPEEIRSRITSLTKSYRN